MIIKCIRVGFLVTTCILICSYNSLAQRLPEGPQELCFLSDIDDFEQPYAIYLPKHFDENKAYPLVVMLHGAGSNHRLALRRVFGKSNFEGENDVEASSYYPEWRDVNMIVAAPYARGTMGYQGIPERDVMDMISDVKRRFNIDENRMYLTGLSMGGGGTLWIGLAYPDLWAAIAPVCPASPQGARELAPNAMHMAVRFVHGTEDGAVPVEVSREWVEGLRALGTTHVEYEELPGVDHWSWVQAYDQGRVFDWFSQYVRDPHPNHVRLSAIDLEHAKSYWVRIDQKPVETTSFIDARISGTNQIIVLTSGVLAFSLDLKAHPMYDDNGDLKVQVDGEQFELSAGQQLYGFSRAPDQDWQPKQYNKSDLVKTPELEGPVSKAFDTRHVYVYGTADNPSEKELQERIDIALTASNWSQYRNEFLGRIKFYPRVVSDKALRESDLQRANLILFGTAETNSIIKSLENQLPFALKENKTKKYGLTYVFPNAQGNYGVICSGLPWWLVEKDIKWRFQPPIHTSLGGIKDYLLFSGNLNTKIEGYFDENWSLSPQQLASLKHTKVLRD